MDPLPPLQVNAVKHHRPKDLGLSVENDDVCHMVREAEEETGSVLCRQRRVMVTLEQMRDKLTVVVEQTKKKDYVEVLSGD